MRYFLRFFILSFSFAFLLISCGPPPPEMLKKNEKTPEDLMKEGMRDMRDGFYEGAIEVFQEIKDKYPYSKYVLMAELKIADALYFKRSYDEAYEAYSEFEKLHPVNPNIPYVIYQKGMCHFERVSTIDRDQYHTRKAKEEFERLIRRFPNSKYVRIAKWRVRKCYSNLAKHELYVANFYLKMKKYRAALQRYRYAIMNYPDIGQYYDALRGIELCEKRLGKAGKEMAKEEEEKVIQAKKRIERCLPCERIRRGRPPALEEEMRKNR
ncbi:MAG: outer membrane protein assembly factor BamD [Deltaproteobacteria bacterium]|nr:MAG: outer membrane protein assembly factor BamD [Deltaproteobacteria bacterium]